uniref:Putative zinc ion binding protein n=1 Tax=Hesperocyparis bakeri TaxID=329080 RepID=A0A3S6KHF6_9CONI|nr:putative zinc ion binding protein [Hesperocyparis bakeri]
MLDDWASLHSASESGSHAINEYAEAYGISGGQKNTESHIFSVDTLERHASKSHGVITCMSAGNNAILVGTNKGWLVRYDFGGGDNYELDLSVSRTVDQTVHRVFVDPGGKHCLAVVLSNGVAETYYIHAKWRKPRILSKLKGLVINAVAWNRQQISEASTRDVIFGTMGGQLYEVVVEEKDKKEKHLKLLYELIELKEPFVSLQMETIATGGTTRYYVMASTPTRLYTFTGTGSLDAVFAAYANRSMHFTELPGEMPSSELHFFVKQRQADFAWLAGAGIYYGILNLGAPQSSSNGDDNFVEKKALVEYSKLENDREGIKPHSLALSEFHFLLLFENKVKVVNRVSQKVIEELQFDREFDSSSREILGLCSDVTAGVFYAYDENSIFEISVHDEGQDMWQVYLDMKEYAAALEHCRNTFQRDQVYSVQAEAAFSTKDFMRAAFFYAKTNYIVSFEEVALKFVAAGEQDALRTFLLRKLDNLGREDRSQITMISTWATELYLDKINRLLLDDDKQGSGTSPSSNEINTKYQDTLREFRDFLSDCKDVLDEATTVKLIGSYGRVDELVFFASLKEQHETVIHHYIQQGETRKALEVLQKPNVSPELQYKFAPDLIMLDPYETVESWMVTSNLNPRRLIPALMRYSSEPHTKDEAHEAIKYLEFCVQRLQNEDPAVHNLLLSLYTKQKDESVLLRFLQCKYGKGRSGRPDIFYDPKYALRLCLKEGRMRACVYIYSMLGMHEAAVALALQVDAELAMAEADKVEDDEDLRKKLWLMVAKHVIEQERGTKRENIRKAIAFLKETDGLLKIEDILPFFPDFALIDDFKEAICSSLEDYNKQIEKLKQEMNDATHGADSIRQDISALAQRYAVVDRDEECGVCGRKILTSRSGLGLARGFTSHMAPFYVFPCEHAFHAQCLIGHVTKHTDPTEAERILDLQRRLSLAVNTGTPLNLERTSSIADEETPVSTRSPTDQIRAQLDDAVAGECPFCGELMIKEISLPFIMAEETEHVMSWDIKGGTFSREYGLT